MRVTVKLFGSVREAAGAKELSVSLPEGGRVADLRALLDRDYPILERYGDRLMVAVNQEPADPLDRLAEDDEVAFLPPVSGGAGVSPRCSVSETPLDVAEVVSRVAGSHAGAVVTFTGAVRDRSRGHAIRHLEYEAYAPMAEREMHKIAAEAATRWPGAQVAIAHRVGHLDVGELAVVVAAAGPHRSEAFAACRFAIDTLKETVPIWKKEVATDGEYWVEDHA